MERVTAVVNDGKFAIVDGIRFDEGATIKNMVHNRADALEKMGLVTIIRPASVKKTTKRG